MEDATVQPSRRRQVHTQLFSLLGGVAVLTILAALNMRSHLVVQLRVATSIDRSFGVAPALPTQNDSSTSAQTKEDDVERKLASLKNLFDKKLISESVYDARCTDLLKTFAM